jgi:hypothetical protein
MAMKRIEALIAVGVMLSLAPALPARADLTMTVLRETYHVWGYVSQLDVSEEDPLPDRYLSDSYDVSLSKTYPADQWTSSIEVSGSARVGDPPVISEAGSSAGRAGNQFHVGHYWFPNGALGGPGNANAQLQADLLFAGSADGLSILASYYIGRPGFDGEPFEGDATLTDLVSGASWEIACTEPLGCTLPFENTHIYRLEMYLEGSPFKSDNELSLQFENVSHVVAAAPLPGAAWLAVIGLGCAGRRLRRRS